ncbi:MAG: hypothetical protein L6290_05540 [Thermodesulfovibrionales bacterium]|nr:hypothetical protein [Thermodesulfovibrionales bacterium]
MKRLVIIFILFLLVASSNQLQAETGLNVAVIAPSVSTSMEARRVVRKQGWAVTGYRNADAILVVVRSMLYNPLNYSYESIHELEEDADSQLNISGENFHIYIYSINDNLSVDQIKHIKYSADD